MYEHTYKLFKNIINDVRTEGKGEILLLNITGQKIVGLYYISLRAKMRVLLLIPQLCLLSKNTK